MSWKIEPDGPHTYAVSTAHGPASRAALVAALVGDAGLRRELSDVLRAAPLRALAWELPALGPRTAALPATFAVMDSPALAAVRADPSPFAAQLAGDAPVATFANLGGDATLVAPSPRAAPDSPHLAAFLRGAPAEVVDELWAQVGRAATARLAARAAPLWISTAGLGVRWLHVRVCDQPKYYRHGPFTDPSA